MASTAVVSATPILGLDAPIEPRTKADIHIRLVFGGGAELLFGGVRDHSVKIPSKNSEDRPADVNFLIHWIRDNLLKERVELFIENNTVRPGILVLINDTDWELEGEGEHVLADNDEIVFISTLHGG